MNPMFDVLATAGGSIVLAAFFLWLMVTAARQERDEDRVHPSRRGMGPAARR